MNVNYLSVGAEHRLLNGITAYFKFDESSGTTATNSYNGSWNLSSTTGVSGGSGKIGTYCVTFDSNSDLVWHSGDTDVPFPGSTGMSISCWIKFNELSSIREDYQRIFTIPVTTELGEKYSTISFITADKIQVNLYDGIGVSIISAITTNTFSIDTWYHLVIVVNATDDIKIYVNSLDDTASSGDFTTICPAGVSTSNFNISSNSATRYLNGFIDEFGIWKRSLTFDEVTELYNSGNGLTYPFE